MISPWYRHIFRTRLAAHRNAVQEFITTRQGYRLATSTGGVLTGRGADIILIDDPLKPEEALSKAQRQACNEWFVHTLYSRLNDKRRGVIVIIMQRLHEDDLVGHVLAQEPWEVLSFPAIAEADEVHRIETIWDRDASRATGVKLCTRIASPGNPRTYPADARRIQFRRPVSAIPRPVGWWPGQGRMVQALPRERTAGPLRPHRAELGHRQQGDRARDFSVCTTWGVKGKDLFLLGLFRKRLEYPALKRAVRDQQSLFNASVVLIEDKASGTQLIQELIADGCYGVTRDQPTGDKTMRLHAQTAMIENGFVHIPETVPWLAEYLHEMTVFPNGKHDDQADSTAQFLDWFKTPFVGQNIFECYRREAEAAEQRRKPQPTKTEWAIGSMEWRAEQKKSR